MPRDSATFTFPSSIGCTVGLSQAPSNLQLQLILFVWLCSGCSKNQTANFLSAWVASFVLTRYTHFFIFTTYTHNIMSVCVKCVHLFYMSASYFIFLLLKCSFHRTFSKKTLWSWSLLLIYVKNLEKSLHLKKFKLINTLLWLC